MNKNDDDKVVMTIEKHSNTKTTIFDLGLELPTLKNDNVKKVRSALKQRRPNST